MRLRLAVAVSLLVGCSGTGTGTGGGSGGSAGGGSGGSAGGGSAGGGAGGSSGGAGGGSSDFDAGPLLGVLDRLEFALDGNESVDLGIDGTGRMHVVANLVGQDAGLSYAVRDADGGWWRATIVAPNVSLTGVGTGVKIQIDANDRAHVAYTHQDLDNPSTRARLFYGVVGPDGGLTPEEIEDAGFQIGVRFGFELDSAGLPHLAYRIRNATFPDGGGFPQTQMYATRSAGGTWTREQIEQFEIGGNAATTLTLDGAGAPHVFYVAPQLDGGTSGAIRHASRVGGAWQREDVVARSFLQSAGAATGRGAQLVLFGEGVVFARTATGWQETFTLGINQCIARAAPNGAVWTLAHRSMGNGYQLVAGRFANGQYAETSIDGGFPGVRYIGMDFAPDGTLYGATMRTGLGVWVHRIR